MSVNSVMVKEGKVLVSLYPFVKGLPTNEAVQLDFVGNDGKIEDGLEKLLKKDFFKNQGEQLVTSIFDSRIAKLIKNPALPVETVLGKDWKGKEPIVGCEEAKQYEIVKKYDRKTGSAHNSLLIDKSHGEVWLFASASPSSKSNDARSGNIFQGIRAKLDSTGTIIPGSISESLQ